MQNQQRSILLWFAFFVIGAGAALLLLYAIAAALHAIRNEGLLGASFYRLLEDFRSLQAVFGPLSVILIAGLAASAGTSKTSRHFRAMSCFLILGLAAGLVLLYFVQFDMRVASNSPWDMEPDEFRSLAYPFFAWTLGAFASGLAALLGVSKLGAASK